MSEDVVRLAVVGATLRRRWRPLLALAVVGALIGWGLSFLVSPGYQAASKALLLGSRDKSQVATETQIATSLGVLDKAAGDLGWGRTGGQLQGSVTATVLDGNVIEIDGVADTPDRARQLTDVVTKHYIEFSTQIVSDTNAAKAAATKQRRDTLQARVDDLATRISAAEARSATAAPGPDADQARAELAQLRTSQESASGDLTTFDRQNADPSNEDQTGGPIAVLEPAQVRGAATPTQAELIAGLAVLAVLLGLFAMMRAARSDARLRGAPAIASALGAPVITTVQLGPDEAQVGSGMRPAGRLRRLLSEDARWSPGMAGQGEENHEESRYRRVLRSFAAGADAPLRLLVVVPVDDDTARRAVARLALSCLADGRPATVLTDNPVMAGLVRDTADAAGRQIGIAEPTEALPDHAVMWLIDIAPGRPTVPDWRHASTSLAVISDGSRTAWELIGIAEACQDAGLPVAGAMLAELRPFLPQPEEPDAPEADLSAHANGASLTGTS